MDQDALVNLFLELVKINGPSLQERAVADFVIGKLKSWNFEVEEDDAGRKLKGSSGNLITRLPAQNRDGQPLLLLAHLDTVRPTAGVKPQHSDGLLKSDGSTILGVDNRAGVALVLHLIGEIVRRRLDHVELEIVFTVGEELGMFGAMALDFARLRGRSGFVFDCTAVPGGYVARTPTAYDFKIAFTGRPAHSAVAPEKGINALSMAVQVMSGFPVGRINEHTVANIGTIHGGAADNVVPDQVAVTGEFRSFAEGEIQRLRDHLAAACAAAERQVGGHADLSFALSFQGFNFEEGDPHVRRLYTAYDRAGVRPEPLVYYGGSDANVFNAQGIRVINVGIGAQNPHANEECIRISDFIKGSEILMHLVEAE